MCVYKTQKALQRAARRHARLAGNKEQFDGTAGVCHSYERVRIEEGKPEIISPEIGTIRLSEQHLSNLVVSHEVVHAALHLYRKLYGTEREWEGSSENADFGNGVSEMEEDFCYLYGDLFRSMVNKLYKYNFWK